MSLLPAKQIPQGITEMENKFSKIYYCSVKTTKEKTPTEADQFSPFWYGINTPCKE